MRIHINHLLWEVNIVSTTDPGLMVDGEMCRGTTWFGKQQIFLAAELNANTALRVIIHELTHAHLYSTQMRLPDTFTEEEVCEFMACWGADIISMANEVYMHFFCPNLDESLRKVGNAAEKSARGLKETSEALNRRANNVTVEEN